jgi:hypothetical protein
MTTGMPLDEYRRALLRRIGKAWRGDWSGQRFDGRDGDRWISVALDGDLEALNGLGAELDAGDLWD